MRIGKHSSRVEYVTCYKHHAAVDASSGLIAKVATSFANTPEISTLQMFVGGTDADKAYASKEIDEMLKQKGVANHICKKEARGKRYECRRKASS